MAEPPYKSIPDMAFQHGYREGVEDSAARLDISVITGDERENDRIRFLASEIRRLIPNQEGEEA